MNMGVQRGLKQMEKEVTVLHETVREMQTTCKFMLKRLNELTQNPHQCTCCKQIEISKKDIVELRKTLRNLEEADTVRDIALLQYQQQIKELLLKQESLQSELSLFAQTDDLKMRHARNGDENKIPTGAKINSIVDDKKAVTPNQTEKGNTPVTKLDQTSTPEDVKGRSEIKEENKLRNTDSMTKLERNSDNTEENNKVDEKQSDKQSHKTENHQGQTTSLKTGLQTKIDDERLPTEEPVTDRSSPVHCVKEDKAPDEPHVVMKLTSVSRHKPNFVKKEDSKGSYNDRSKPNVEVVVQRYKKYKRHGMLEWDLMMTEEMENGKKDGLVNLGGVHAVILLDISESMKDAWTQVQTFFNDYIAGLEAMADRYGITDEHVALVTFGHETMVQQRLTNNFKLIREKFVSLKVGGPSPLTPGYLLALAAAGSSDKQVAIVNGITTNSKIIIITDGEPTEPDLYEGPDVMDPGKMEAAKRRLLSDMETASKINVDMFFVPVGKANMDFIELLRAIAEGTMLTYKDGRRLSRRTFLAVHSNPFGIDPILLPRDETFSEQDREDMKALEEKGKTDFAKVLKKQDSYLERTDSNLPAPGSRVRRGLDWIYTDEQDEYKPGTVVGHVPDYDRIWVKWDTTWTGCFNYKYGYCGCYDVLLVDEPRVPEPGTLMAVGCDVEPGIGWKSGGGKSRPDKGVVLRLHMDSSNIPKALVRWSSTNRGDYTYMADSGSHPEVVLCQKIKTDFVIRPQANQQSTRKYQKKNKNKNA